MTEIGVERLGPENNNGGEFYAGQQMSGIREKINCLCGGCEMRDVDGICREINVGKFRQAEFVLQGFCSYAVVNGRFGTKTETNFQPSPLDVRG